MRIKKTQNMFSLKELFSFSFQVCVKNFFAFSGVIYLKQLSIETHTWRNPYIFIIYGCCLICCLLLTDKLNGKSPHFFNHKAMLNHSTSTVWTLVTLYKLCGWNWISSAYKSFMGCDGTLSAPIPRDKHSSEILVRKREVLASIIFSLHVLQYSLRMYLLP